jgi:hypothetical protein
MMNNGAMRGGMPFEDDEESGPTQLQAALLALRRELEGTAYVGHPSDRRPWKLDRIRVRMAVSCVACPGGKWEWVPSLGASPHTVDLEWGPEGAESRPSVPLPFKESSSAIQSAAWTPETGERVGVVLDGAFGPPGFDSAARATVFRESAIELGPDSLQVVLTALMEGRRLEESGLERARHAIQRLLERGPAGGKSGAGILRDVFGKHPFDALLTLTEHRWRYGTGHDLGPI